MYLLLCICVGFGFHLCSVKANESSEETGDEVVKVIQDIRTLGECEISSMIFYNYLTSNSMTGDGIPQYLFNTSRYYEENQIYNSFVEGSVNESIANRNDIIYNTTLTYTSSQQRFAFAQRIAPGTTYCMIYEYSGTSLSFTDRYGYYVYRGVPYMADAPGEWRKVSYMNLVMYECTNNTDTMQTVYINIEGNVPDSDGHWYVNFTPLFNGYKHRMPQQLYNVFYSNIPTIIQQSQIEIETVLLDIDRDILQLYRTIKDIENSNQINTQDIINSQSQSAQQIINNQNNIEQQRHNDYIQTFSDAEKDDLVTEVGDIFSTVQHSDTVGSLFRFSDVLIRIQYIEPRSRIQFPCIFAINKSWVLDFEEFFNYDENMIVLWRFIQGVVRVWIGLAMLRHLRTCVSVDEE